MFDGREVTAKIVSTTIVWKKKEKVRTILRSGSYRPTPLL